MKKLLNRKYFNYQSITKVLLTDCFQLFLGILQEGSQLSFVVREYIQHVLPVNYLLIGILILSSFTPSVCAFKRSVTYSKFKAQHLSATYVIIIAALPLLSLDIGI